MKLKHLTILPFHIPWAWTTDYLNQTAQILSKNGLVICFMWSDYLTLKEYFVKRKLPIIFKKHSKNIYIFTPILFIPFRRFRLIVKTNELINIFLLKTLSYLMQIYYSPVQKIIWITDPRLSHVAINFGKTWKIIYDCIDYCISGRNLKETLDLKRMEKMLVKNAFMVTANSNVLYKHLAKYGVEPLLVPQGFRLESFNKHFTGNSPTIKRYGRPLIGYVGALNNRIDYGLLYKIAKSKTKWDFAIWGPYIDYGIKPGQKKNYMKLKSMSHVFMGSSDKKEIPNIIRQFDVGIIPYDISDDFNRYSFPMKLFEYFYLGKPVLSTPISELEYYKDLVYISKDADGWAKTLELLLRTKWDNKKKLKQKNLAMQNSWNKKIGKIYANLPS